MANELTFKIIDIRNLIELHMQGHMGEQELIDNIGAVLSRDGATVVE